MMNCGKQNEELQKAVKSLKPNEMREMAWQQLIRLTDYTMR